MTARALIVLGTTSHVGKTLLAAALGRIYAHGLFDDDGFRHAFIHAARAACNLAPARKLAFITAERETRIDRLALHLRRSLDNDRIKSWIG